MAQAKRTALYPGTFDPITNGHLDIIRRAIKLCDHLVIGIAINRDKAPLFSLKDRAEMVRTETAQFSGDGRATIEVKPFENLTVQFAEEVGASVIVRGLRAVSDFEFEFQLTGTNYRLNPNIETMFLMAEASQIAIASSLVKEIARLGGDISSFVPKRVAERLRKKFDKQNGEK
jgi:pantetheine-phosphate adenylyltransferase